MSVAEEVEDLNSFGVTLGLPGNVMSGIMESSSNEKEIAKDLFQVRAMASNPHTQRFESLF